MIDGFYAPVGGKEGKAYAMSQLAWHVALGRGDPAWDAVDRGNPLWQSALLPDAAQARGLVSEIGRRVADEVAFVLPDPQGEIVLPDSRWTRCAPGVVSNHLYIQAFLDYPDGAAETVREMGLYAGATHAASVPAGRRWVAPGDLQSSGHLMRLVRYASPIQRSPSNRPLFHLVETF